MLWGRGAADGQPVQCLLVTHRGCLFIHLVLGLTWPVWFLPSQVVVFPDTPYPAGEPAPLSPALRESQRLLHSAHTYFLAYSPGWTRECFQEWGSYTRLAIPSLFMVCIEWWTFEIGTFLAGLSVPGEPASSLGSHSPEASQKWKLLWGTHRGLQHRHEPAASHQRMRGRGSHSAMSSCVL